MSIKDKIDRTKSLIKNHKVAIKNLEDHGRALALKSTGLEVGDRIIVSDRGREYEVEVTGVRYWTMLPPPIKGFRVNKDGAVGKQSAGYISEWRKKEESA